VEFAIMSLFDKVEITEATQIPHPNEPVFKLVSCTENPVETLFAAWAQSRPTRYPLFFGWLKDRNGGDETVTAQDVLAALAEGILDEQTLTDVFTDVIAMEIPVAESVHFTWNFTNLPISWREQAVRERQWGFWLTSAREFDNRHYVDEGRFNVAPRIKAASESGDPNGVEAFEVLMSVYLACQEGYARLRQLGFAEEEARDILPLGMKHHGSMFSNFRTLLHSVRKRTCWIAQLDLWLPVIWGIAEQLRKKHPAMRGLVSPPCFKPYSNTYTGCTAGKIAGDRVRGIDPYAPCPIYMRYERPNFDVGTQRFLATTPDAEVYEKYLQYMEQSPRAAHAALARKHLPIWRGIWGRDPHTGKLEV
jgi:hypothetical protein